MTIKSVRMYGPGNLKLEQVPVPQVKENEALVKIMAVGICGSDIPRVNKYGAYISPITPGHEFSGIIEKTGDAVKSFKAGDRVTVPPLMPCFKCDDCKAGNYVLCKTYNYFGSRCDGAFAQYVAVPETNLLKLPDNVGFKAAATTDPLANALHVIKRGGFKAGDKVCVFGAGPIGLYIIQYAAAKGAKQVVAVDVSETKLKTAADCGASVCLNGLDADIVKKVIEATNGGADMCVDASGVPSAQVNAIMSAAKLGRMVFLGISHKPLTLPEEAVDKVMRHEMNIIGSWNSFSKPFPGWEWTHAVESLSDGTIQAEKIITHVLGLEDVADTFKRIDERTIEYNKILFLPWGDTD